MAAAKSAATAWKPALFDSHQIDTIATLADLIIPRTDTPGARDVKVHEYIDLIIKDGPVEPRRKFLEGLGWIDGYAMRLHQKPFIRCSPAEQNAMLSSLSTYKPDPKQGLNRAGTPDRAAEPDSARQSPERPAGGPAATQTVQTPGEPDISGGATFFRMMKMLTVQGYYTTKEGIDELNKGGRVPGSFGCAHGTGEHA